MAPRHQTEVSTDVAGSPEAFGIINCRCECESRELPDTGNAHQPAARIGRSDHPSYVAIDRHDGGEHGGTRRNQTLHGSGQARHAASKAADTSGRSTHPRNVRLETLALAQASRREMPSAISS